MKRFFLGLLLSLFATLAAAQAPVQFSPTRLDAVGFVATSATSAATITISVPAAQYAYITALDITNCAGTAVTAAAPTSVTTTNLNGATWTIGSGSTAGLCQPQATNGAFPNPIKSQSPGTNVTFVLPTFVTNQVVRVSVYYYLAP